MCTRSSSYYEHWNRESLLLLYKWALSSVSYTGVIQSQYSVQRMKIYSLINCSLSKASFLWIPCSELNTLLALPVYLKYRNARMRPSPAWWWLHVDAEPFLVTSVLILPYTCTAPSNPTAEMCMSDFAVLCWVTQQAVPKIADLHLITTACPHTIGWSFNQPGVRHDGETMSQHCLHSNAFLTFFVRWKARGHSDITVAGLSKERESVCVCVRERVKN